MAQRGSERWAASGVFSRGEDSLEIQPEQGALVGRPIWVFSWPSQVCLPQNYWWRDAVLLWAVWSHAWNWNSTNCRPLSYVVDDIQLLLRSNHLPEQEPWREGDFDLCKRVKYLKACWDSLWKQWMRKYIAALWERHNLNHKGQPKSLKIGEVVIIHSEGKNHGKWPLGIVQQLCEGWDRVVHVVNLRVRKTHLERLVQHIYPLELTCDNHRWAPALPVQLSV